MALVELHARAFLGTNCMEIVWAHFTLQRLILWNFTHGLGETTLGINIGSPCSPNVVWGRNYLGLVCWNQSPFTLQILNRTHVFRVKLLGISTGPIATHFKFGTAPGPNCLKLGQQSPHTQILTSRSAPTFSHVFGG